MSSYGSKEFHTSTSRRTTRRSTRKSLDRPLLVLHIVSAQLSFISIGLFVSIIPIWSSNFFFAKGTLRGDWPDALPIVPLLLTVGVSIHYLVRNVLRKRQTIQQGGDYLKNRTTISAIPPKFRLCLLVTIEMLLLTFLIVAGTTGLYRFWRPAMIASSGHMTSSGTATTLISTLSVRGSVTDANPTNLLPPSGKPSNRPDQQQKAAIHSCSIANILTKQCNPTLYLIGGLQIAAIAIGSFVWLLNLIILTLHLREYQYQKRRLQRSLRAKAKARLEALESDLSRAEKGDHSSSQKKIHHEKKERRHQRSHSGSDGPHTSTRNDLSSVTRPHRAYTTPVSRGGLSSLDTSVVRPKQYFYNPDISSSRTRPIERSNSASTVSSRTNPQTVYGQAIQEARRTTKPAESMRDWLATGRRA